MCRLVAYLGRQTLLANVLVAPKNSIVMQSLRARETNLRTNGDGFGVAWYASEISAEPALFTSISPAWNDRNLLSLTSKIQSSCFFAHVRSASAGGVSNDNCHPFVFSDWTFMHNGELHGFMSVKRHLRHLLDDDIYNWIKGDTDSEHLFALFLQLAKGRDLNDLAVVGDVLHETMKKTEALIKQHAKSGVSYFNICLSDGHRLVATRYSSHIKKKPLTMHYLVGYAGLEAMDEPAYFVVSSEKLNDLNMGWEEVPAQSMLLVDTNKKVQLRSLV